MSFYDAFNPLETIRTAESDAVNIDDAKIRNRINAMKAREQFQTMQRKEKWDSMADDPLHFNPLQEANQFQPGQPQAGQPTQNRPPMQSNPAVLGVNQGVQALGGQVIPGHPNSQGMAPQAQQDWAQRNSDINNMSMQSQTPEDISASRGEKKLASMGQSVQGLVTSAKNDPAARYRINKTAELANNDPDVKAYAAKNGFDEFSYHMDQETGEGEYTLSRDWSKELLEDFAIKAPNGQLLKPLAKHPGKYRIKFGDAGQVTDIQFIGGGALTKEQLSSDRELANLAISEPDSPRGQQAQKILDAEKGTKKELKASAGSAAGSGGGSSLSQDAIELEAQKVVKGEKLGNYGYGKVGAAMKSAVLNRVAKIAKEKGLDASALIANSAKLTGQKAGEKDIIKRQAIMSTFVNRIDKTSDVVMDYAKKLGNTDNRLLNIPRNKLASMVGSGVYRAYELSLVSLSQEIGKVESGSLGIAGVSETQSSVMRAIHDPNLSVNQLLEVINAGKRLGKTAMDAAKQSTDQMTDEIIGADKTAKSETRKPGETIADYLKRVGQ